jgi:hypothetical protein
MSSSVLWWADNDDDEVDEAFWVLKENVITNLHSVITDLDCGDGRVRILLGAEI